MNKETNISIDRNNKLNYMHVYIRVFLKKKKKPKKDHVHVYVCMMYDVVMNEISL